MSTTQIDYESLADKAMRGVVRDALRIVEEQGDLSEDHILYIAFQTQWPGVRIPDRLLEKHPEEITIVLQHQFWDLKVEEDAFSVGLSFNHQPENLRVPYAALVGFQDRGLGFTVPLNALPLPEVEEKAAPPETDPVEDDVPQEEGVVSLAAFRKRSQPPGDD